VVPYGWRCRRERHAPLLPALLHDASPGPDGRGVVKYLRGDVADDVIDTYTHNWGDQVRETYEANVYQLLR